MSLCAAVLIDTRPSSFDVRGVVMAEGDGCLITAPSHHTRANTTRLSLGSCRESVSASEESHVDEAGDEGRDEHVTKSLSQAEEETPPKKHSQSQ